MDHNFDKQKTFSAGALGLLFLSLLVLGGYFLLKSPAALKAPETNGAGKNETSMRPGTAKAPGSALVFDPFDWKITLPVGSEEDQDVPLEIRPPELSAYVMYPWFAPTPDKKGFAFRAPVNGAVTGGTDYPRSELREMQDGGKENAFWPSTEGTHSLFLDQAITAVPKNKPEVVAGQIHGDDDDLITIRLDYPLLHIARGKQNLATLDENYILGKRFSVRFIAQDGRVAVYYNNAQAPAYVLEKKVKQAYFKAGVYTQSNCETEEDKNLCRDDNFGEVVIYKAEIVHQ
jgi:hypothetical protein